MRHLLPLAVWCAGIAVGADWPEWRNSGRTGVWSEDGVLDRFPPEGLRVRWRTPVGSGFSGPAVAGGRVFVLDFRSGEWPRGTERALALDEKTGRILWTREWAVNYTGLMRSYAIGPRTTPSVDGDRVYVQGAMGALLCLKAATGEVVWQQDFVAGYKTAIPTWGMSASPLIDGNRLIALVGGEGNAKVVAFDKFTGKESWRALASDAEPGYAPPVRVGDQIIAWHPLAVTALQPATGETMWEIPFTSRMGLSVATPISDGRRLLVTSFYTGPLMIELAPKPRVLWKGSSDSEIRTDKLHALITTPVLDGDYLYGVCSYGQLRCLRASTGERVWETLALTKERARWAAAMIVRHQGRYFINNDRGELVIARLQPEGFEEISRTPLIKPTSTAGIGRRELGAVNWSHPAYANRHIFARNDEEILCASLESR